MTINIDAVRRQVKGVLMRFPSVTAEVRRPVLNDYGEETGEFSVLHAGLTAWWAQPDRPKGVRTKETGTTLDEDDRKWVCLIWDSSLDDVTRGDLIAIDGTTYRIRNTETRMQVRVFWQVEEV